MNTRFSSAIVSENSRGFAAVIPDIKCVSPKEGDLTQGRDPVETAKALAGCGAPLLSVVTEQTRFGGSPGLLRAIAKAVDIPILRKDFIADEAQLVETAELGASAVLLICALTQQETLTTLYQKAVSLGLEPLVEAHTAQEMAFCQRLGAKLVGINNRNIAAWETDGGGPSRTAELSRLAPRGAVLVSESGILSRQDAALAVASGAHAVLVGTALWQAADICAFYQTLRVERGR